MPEKSISVRQGLILLFLGVLGFSVLTNVQIVEHDVDLDAWMRTVSLDPTQPSCQSHVLQLASNSTARIITTVTEVPRLFHCGGYALNRNLKPTLESLLPEYQWINLRRIQDWRGNDMLASASNPWDILVSNYQLDECKDPAFFQWLHLRFAGKMVFWTPEDGTNYLDIVDKPNYYFLGPGAPLTLTFLQTAFWAQVPDPEKQEIFFGTPDNASQHRRRSKGTHFLIYAHSNCVAERDSAFRSIATYKDGIFPTIHHGGKCNGGLHHEGAGDSFNTLTSRIQKYPNKNRLGNWEDNRHLYQDFRFCLTMEHTNTPGYITEKILVAFWAGCLPIYWGPKDEIMNMFHPESFIFWDVDDPLPALERILYLETNRSAYEQAVSSSILAPGALERYFSMDERYGAGALKVEMRKYLGLDGFHFAKEIHTE